MRPPLCLTVAAYAKRRSALELSEHSWNTNRELIGSLSFLLGKEVNSGKARGKGQRPRAGIAARGQQLGGHHIEHSPGGKAQQRALRALADRMEQLGCPKLWSLADSYEDWSKEGQDD